MSTPRVVAGTVTALGAAVVELHLGTDPDTGEALTASAAVPELAVGAVAWALIGDHGAVVIPAPGGSGAPMLVEFRTYAELRDGITVPRAPAPTADPATDTDQETRP